ncbi:hypothetical protein BMS3Bbin01_02582 [bacterium BMS3Bbin01]|nr:hypothetical protein BMS3Bbin01_02582 [bacterium BMS3Bbin01]
MADTADREGWSGSNAGFVGLRTVVGMATHSPSSKTPKLVAIERRVATYESVLLSDVQAAELLPALRALVLDADPSSAADAAATLSSACRFLADVAPDVGGDLAVLLTEERVARWSHAQKRAGMNEGTLKNHLSRLARLVRVKGGLPARMQIRSTKKAADPPLDMVGLLGLVDGLDADAVAAVVAGAGAGLVVPDAVGATVAVDGTRIVDAEGGEHVVLDPWVAAARAVAGVTVSRAGWGRAMTAAKRDGIALSADRLRLTWTVSLLGLEVPVGLLIPRFGLTRRAVDKAVAHLGSLPAGTAAGWLRG